MEATSVDIDAIDADMHARAGDAELIPWLLVPDCAPQLIRIACSLSSRLMAALFGAAAVLLSPEDVLLLREAHAAPPRSNR